MSTQPTVAMENSGSAEEGECKLESRRGVRFVFRVGWCGELSGKEQRPAHADCESGDPVTIFVITDPSALVPLLR